MRNLSSLLLMLTVSFAAEAQQDVSFIAKKIPLYATGTVAIEDMESANIGDLEELEIAFSSDTTTAVSTAVVSEADILLLQVFTEPGQTRTIPVQIVSSTRDSGPAGLTELMDGLVVANSGSHAFLLAPAALHPDAVAAGLATWGTVIQTDDGRLEIFNPAFEPALHFSAAFTFAGIRQTQNTGAVVLQLPRIRNSNSSEQFYTLIYADGAEEVLQPIVAPRQLMNTLAALQVDAEYDRNQGVMTINGKTYRPSYFVEALQTETALYLATNADDFELAFIPDDINEDGVMDYQVISPSGSQWLYGQSSAN